MKNTLERLKKISDAYRATVDELAGISTERPWGQAPAVGSVIMQGMIDKLPAKLDGMAERWAVLEGWVK